MRKTRLVVLLAVAMVFAVSVAAMAAQGTWKSLASDSTGKLTDIDSQAAYVTSTRTGAQTKVTGVEWINTANPADALTKGVDYSSTTTDGAKTVWNINDNNAPNPNGNTYFKQYITPASFDNSRGLVMAKVKVISSTGVNATFGFSTGSFGTGMQFGIRAGAIRAKDGDGGSPTIPGYSDQTLDTTSDYRVYALSWVDGKASMWYSNGNDWSSSASGWTQIVNDYTMAGGATKDNAGNNISGIVLFDSSSSNTWNGNIEWIAQNTYDDINGEMNPWDFNPAPMSTVPEPGSILALMTGLVGFIGLRRRH